MYFGEHPRPGVHRIAVRDGLRVYLDEDGRIHSITAREPIGTRTLIVVLGSLRLNVDAVLAAIRQERPNE